MKPGTMVIVLTTIVLGACTGERSGAEWGGQVDTLPNGALHVRNPASGVWDSSDAWRLEEDLRIGRAEGEGPDVFGGQVVVAVHPSGALYVLDRQSNEVRVFDASGAHVRSFGRQGAGPGEFRQPNGIAVDDDGNVWVVDPGNMRYSIFDADGRFLRSRPRNIMSWGFLWGGQLDSEGRVIEQTSIRREEGSFTGYVFTSADQERADTLVLPATPPRPVWEVSTADTRMMLSVPFSSGRYTAPDPSAHVWVGHTDGYRLTKLNMSGDSVLVVERMHQRLPVTPGERARALENTTSQLPPGATVDAALIPTQKPVFSGLSTDHEGNLWVRLLTHDDTTSATFDVFDTGGRYLGEVRSPVALASWEQPVITRDAMYVVARDALDIPYVVRLRIRRSADAA